MDIHKLHFLFALLFCLPGTAAAQLEGFEGNIPQGWSVAGGGSIHLSRTYSKQGQQSLEWQFVPGSTLQAALPRPFTWKDKADDRHGIQLWVYNERPTADSLRFELLSEGGEASHRFAFRLSGRGWRACWISLKSMLGGKGTPPATGLRLTAPGYEGRVFLDRLSFPVARFNPRTTPDMQMPYSNTSASRNDLAHWCRIWEWEQAGDGFPLPREVDRAGRKALQTLARRLDKMLAMEKAPMKTVEKAYALFRLAGIRPSGKGFAGAPLVAKDDGLDRAKGELSLDDVEAMLSGFAYDACCNRSAEAEQKYFATWAYALDQGLAYGSGMGTNHHYGYQLRKLFTSAWLMRDAIRRSPQGEDIIAAIRYWAGLAETRKPYDPERDGVADCWHTLLMARAVAALLPADERKQAQGMQGLARWVNTSLQPTPGTVGGIKPDGTMFHHGGFYPAYASGTFGALGQYVRLAAGTPYQVEEQPRRVLKSALLALCRYSNNDGWGIGLCGRHPFSSNLRGEDIDALAYVALAGDLSGRGEACDRQLAAEYLRLCKNPQSALARTFREQGIEAAEAPQGFFTYNYGAAGIFRRDDWMVTLKGMNTDVWGAEIYAKDNRYGRYQSYGSVQIMAAQSQEASGYGGNGWDWNRLPGTTTLHLPFDSLDAPYASTMARSPERFAGSSSLEGSNGMFAMKLHEAALPRFTPSFVARKSVFCFGNRMVCLGTGISNDNPSAETETTLFQVLFREGKTRIPVDGKEGTAPGFRTSRACGGDTTFCLGDGYGNYYYVRQGEMNVQIARQESRHEKTRSVTRGTFATAWLAHGKAPHEAGYEYLVWVQPGAQELAATARPADSYRVLLRDNRAHIVNDLPTGITAYAVFETFAPENDGLFLSLPAETMVMRRTLAGKSLVMSVCSPDLNIGEKAYATSRPSRPATRQFLLKGRWKQDGQEDGRVKLSDKGGNTLLSVTCQHGLPVEFRLVAR